MSGVFGLAGSTLAHSLSPMIHSKLGDYSYTLMPVSPDGFVSLMEKREFDGINVTLPYKKEAFRLCDRLDDTAKRTGSVNVVVNRRGVLTGYNTDLGGFLYALGRAGVSLEGKKVLVLGSGGAAQSVIAAAEIQGAERVATVSRRGRINYENVYDVCADAQVIINATPVGMYPDGDASPLDPGRFPMLEAAGDVVYNPLRTRFSCDSRALGIPVADGLAMLVAQATEASELFTGEKGAKELTDEILGFVRREVTDCVLIGMPGSGKTTVGAACAKARGRRFIDTDALVESSSGESPAAIIASCGEARFRTLESEAVRTACSELGCVISVGGGAVLSAENVRRMRSNGVCVFLERDFSLLDSRERPLFVREGGAESIWNKRKDFYLDATDVTADNNASVSDAAEKVWRAFDEAVDN